MNRTVLHLQMRHDTKLPEEFRDDVRYTQALVEHYLERFTIEGDLVLDPFMGFGTTLIASEKMKRRYVGIEYDATRCSYVRTLLKEPDAVQEGDSRKIKELACRLNLPPIDFCITSPPYMGKNHQEDPFTAYSTRDGEYERYLEDLKNIFAQIDKLMKPGAAVIIEVSNLKHEDGTLTTLAWDIAREISKVLLFTGEEVIFWDPTYSYGYDQSYCLIFRASSHVAKQHVCL